MTAKPPPDLNELNAMAIEACDMWQEHLSSFAQDPNARAELTRFLEPQRRLFADWAGLMQKSAQATGATTEQAPERTPGGDGYDHARAKAAGAAAAPAQSAQHAGAAAPAPAAAAAGGVSSGDDPLRAAQLALRLAELEKRVAKLEAASVAGPAGKTRRA